jgi:GNAT superfamily N-acetyltransferase
MSFIKEVWGGHDYIPRVWEEWLRDNRGRMFVVEADGVPVGMNRVRFLEDGSAWFEGARVHPAFRGRGLASMLGENSAKFAKERGAKVFRLTSGSRNLHAHRQIGRIGFKEVSRFSVYQPSSVRRRRSSGVAKEGRSAEFPELMRLIEGSREFKLGSGVYWHDFAATSLTPDVVKKLIAKGSVWRWRDAVAVAMAGGEGSEMWEEVCFLGGPAFDSVDLARSLIGRRKRAAERWVFLPQSSPIISALRRVGYERNFSMVLFERTAANG